MNEAQKPFWWTSRWCKVPCDKSSSYPYPTSILFPSNQSSVDDDVASSIGDLEPCDGAGFKIKSSVQSTLYVSCFFLPLILCCVYDNNASSALCVGCPFLTFCWAFSFSLCEFSQGLFTKGEINPRRQIFLEMKGIRTVGVCVTCPRWLLRPRTKGYVMSFFMSWMCLVSATNLSVLLFPGDKN